MPTYICGNNACKATFDVNPAQPSPPCPKCRSKRSWPCKTYICTRCLTRFLARETGPGKAPNCGYCRSDATGRELNERELQTYRGPLSPVLRNIFEMCDERTLGLLALVCTRFRDVAVPLLQRWVPPMRAFGSTTHRLKNVLIAPDEGILTGAHALQVAVDQFTHPGYRSYKGSILEYIIENNISINLNLGTASPEVAAALKKAAKTIGEAPSNTVSVSDPSAFHKMHNKVWVIDKEGVIVGSPNISYAGMEGGNFESFIYIRSPRVGAMFGKYLRYLKEPNNDALWNEVGYAVTEYNREQHGLRLAMAPLIKITDFLVTELAGATKIVIRQFLISSWRPGRKEVNVLQTLCNMAKKGVDIEIYLDEEAYATQHHVREAVGYLLEAGVKVFTQKPVYVVNAGSERIQHDKLILATIRTGRMVTPVHRTLIGTAGLTRDVILNNNAESFIATDILSIYQASQAHHLQTLDPKVAKTTQIVLKKA